MHWTNFIALTVLFMSGLHIFNAHPALYWGDSSYSGRPPLLQIGSARWRGGERVGVTRVFGHEFETTGLLGLSKYPNGEPNAHAFPSWLTIPGGVFACDGARLALLLRVDLRSQRRRVCAVFDCSAVT